MQLHSNTQLTDNTMPGQLKRTEHEQFAQAIADGQTQASAYHLCYQNVNEETALTNAGRLLRRADVIERIEELRKAKREHAIAQGAGLLAEGNMYSRIGRARDLVAQIEKIDKVIAERAVYPDHQDVPGGSTGLVVTFTRNLGKNGTEKAHQIDEAIIKMRMQLSQQVAKELGQWVEKVETTKRVEEFTSEDWSREIAQYAAKIGVPIEVLSSEAEKRMKETVQ